MAITSPTIETTNPTIPATLLVHLASLSHEAFERVLANLAAAFPTETILVTTPDATPHTFQNITVLSSTPVAPAVNSWLLTASDFLSTYKLAQDHHSAIILLLGPESQTLSIEALRALAEAIHSGRDLALPRYTLGPRDGLVNSAILYPVTRALYAARPRFPLAVDLGLSSRMAERLAIAAQRFTAANQSEALLWPVAEAAIAGFSISEVPAGHRTLPAPATMDLNTVLAEVAGSLFADAEAKATYWQRARVSAAAPTIGSAFAAQVIASDPESGVGSNAIDLPEDIAGIITPMLDSFRLAYTNLHEIWALVLPPNSLVGLKKLSLLPADNFHLPDALWVRIVYDFLLAYRLRTLNRGHLLGALTPLYLAWAASHLQLTAAGTPPEQHIEQLADAFEADKPYIVSRWRWPDRFNP